MGLLDRFLSRREIEFAEKLAESIHRKLPPENDASVSRKGKQGLDVVLESVLKDIDVFRKESRPGWLGTARLGNTLRWKLIELGYSKPLVEDLTEIVIRQVMMK